MLFSYVVGCFALIVSRITFQNLRWLDKEDMELSIFYTFLNYIYLHLHNIITHTRTYIYIFKKFKIKYL